MQLMRLTDVPSTHRERVFYHSRLGAVAGGLLVLAVVFGLVVFGWVNSSWPAYFGAVDIFFCFLIFHKLILARFRPSNWLLRLKDTRMFIKIRSYLPARFP